jgi:hypothetical protein
MSFWKKLMGRRDAAAVRPGRWAGPTSTSAARATRESKVQTF